MERRSKRREDAEQTVSNQDLEDYVYEEIELETTFNDIYGFDSETGFTYFRY